MRLNREGQPVAIPQSAFTALLLLIENRDRVVSKRELLERVWAGTAVEENNLNQCISALRKAFGDTRKEARFIATASGAGYRFVMNVVERDREIAPLTIVVPGQSAAPSVWRPGFAMALAVGLGLLLGVVGGRVIPRTATAILVLPIQSYGPPRDDFEYIRRGMATEIEAALARSPGLHVAAGIPESVLKSSDVREIARKVNARAVLRGQIRESDSLLTFTFELVNPEANAILWSDQFGMKPDDIASAESRVVSGVYKTLDPGHAPPERPAVNPAAHELYLRGRVAAITRMPGDLDKAAALFERAIALDPSYADAYTGIADAYGLQAANGPAPPAVLEKARAAALRAIELDRDSAPAHAALGLVYYADWNWAAARGELLQAVALNPYYSITHHRLALLHYVFNGYGDAERELKLAQSLNPYLTAHGLTLAEVYISARRYNDAIGITQSLMHASPREPYSHFLAFEAYREMGDRAAALKEIRLGAGFSDDPSDRATLAIAEGRFDDARRIAAVAGRDDGLWAMVYAQLGDRERMLTALRCLIDNRNVVVVEMKDDPVYDRYRKDAAFQELIGRLHLPASQRSSGGFAFH
jgi:DNA-binding winged helix-turn-helix (wHTH) protein/TolB-like protein/Tfp pilus assembly protein PilF